MGSGPMNTLTLGLFDTPDAPPDLDPVRGMEPAAIEEDPDEVAREAARIAARRRGTSSLRVKPRSGLSSPANTGLSDGLV
jgi:hypothetical protein